MDVIVLRTPAWGSSSRDSAAHNTPDDRTHTKTLTSDNFDKERVKFGFDRASNRVWRQNTVAATGQDEYYTYYGLYQIKSLQRGTLNSTKTGITGTSSWEENWNYDPMGNWHG